MPAAISAAAPSLICPYFLCRAFRQSRSFQTQQNTYPDGEWQSNSLSITSRKSWEMSGRLTAAQRTSLQSFYDSVVGPSLPFYFYDLYETSPVFSYDGSGSAVAGKYTVRFDGPLVLTLDAGRYPYNGLKLIEVQ